MSIIIINGRNPDVRVDDVVILVYHMFEAKMLTFHRRSVTSKGNLFSKSFHVLKCNICGTRNLLQLKLKWTNGRRRKTNELIKPNTRTLPRKPRQFSAAKESSASLI